MYFLDLASIDTAPDFIILIGTILMLGTLFSAGIAWWIRQLVP